MDLVISIQDENEEQVLLQDLRKRLSESNLSYWEAIGILECLKKEILDYLYSEPEDKS